MNVAFTNVAAHSWCDACRYEKYTTDEEKKDRGKNTDKFMDAYEGLVEKITDLTLVRRPLPLPCVRAHACCNELPSDIQKPMQKSEAINQEKNRAQKAAQYAELRCACSCCCCCCLAMRWDCQLIAWLPVNPAIDHL